MDACKKCISKFNTSADRLACLSVFNVIELSS